jgi:hypothetical protein
MKFQNFQKVVQFQKVFEFKKCSDLKLFEFLYLFTLEKQKRKENRKKHPKGNRFRFNGPGPSHVTRAELTSSR